MALGNVFMKDLDGNIGREIIDIADRNCGLLFDISGQSNFWTAHSEFASTWNGSVVELNSLEDAEKLGITPFTGTNTDILAGIPYYHIQQFFGMAGGTGRLFVMFADCSANWNALLEMQRASNGIISQFGVWTEQCLWNKMDESATTYSISIVGDLQSIAEQMADDYFAPASIILTANTAKVKTSESDLTTIDIAQIPDAIINSRYVSVLLGQAIYYDAVNKAKNVQEMQASLTSATPVGCVGLALGTLARCNVSESLAWVAAYDLVNYVPAIEMGFGNSTKVDGKLTNTTLYSALTKTQLDSLDDKGYIFLRTYEGLEGHTYFTKDQTCSNGDYCTIARNRAINKSRRMVRTALLPYVNSPIKVDPSNGSLSAAQITIFRNTISSVLDSMVKAEEISGVGAINIPASQNILVTKRLQFSYSIIPYGCAESINVTEGLAVSQ